MARPPRRAAVAAQRSIRASFETPYPLQEETSGDEIIEPTSNDEAIDLTGDDEEQSATALDEGAAAVTPTLRDTIRIEVIQQAVSSIQDPPPAVSTASRSLQRLPLSLLPQRTKGEIPDFSPETIIPSPLIDDEYHTQE